MVYKKFGNKIPSLSSLLLAGALLPGGCGSCPGASKTTPSEEPKSLGDDQSNINKAATGSGGPDVKLFSPAYKQAVLDMVKYLTNIAALDYLNSGYSPLALIDEGELKGKPKRAVEKVQEKFRAISQDRFRLAYPKVVAESFSHLGDDKLIAKINENTYYGYARMLNALLDVGFRMHNAFKKFLEISAQGAPKNEKDKLIKDFVDFYQVKLDPSKSLLNIRTKYFNAPSNQLPTGDQFARFLSSEKEDGTQKGNGNQYGIPENLKAKRNVWLNIVSKDTVRSDADISSVAIRGARIGEDGQNRWTVSQKGNPEKASKTKILYIPSVRDDELKHSYKVNSAQSVITFTSSSTLDGYAAALKELSGYQLLFTLFKGNQGLDLFSLHPSENKKYIKLVANDKNFQTVSNIKDEQRFAALLGQHIADNPELNELFPTPDEDDILREILKDVSNDKIVDQSANEGGLSSKDDVAVGSSQQKENLPAGLPEDVQLIGEGSMADKLLTNLVKVIGFNADAINKNNSGDAQSKIRSIMEVGTDIDSSNASLDQKLAIRLLNKLVHEKALHDNKKGSGKALIAFVKDVIREELKKAVVYKSEGKYKATPITIDLMDSIKLIADGVNEKHKKSHVTFNDCEKIDPAKKEPSNETGFVLSKVYEAYNDAYKRVKALIEAPIDVVLSVKGPEVDYPNLLKLKDIIVLDKNDYESLDAIRLKYQKDNESPAV